MPYCTQHLEERIVQISSFKYSNLIACEDLIAKRTRWKNWMQKSDLMPEKAVTKSKWSSTMVVPSIRSGVWVGGLLLQSGIAHCCFWSYFVVKTWSSANHGSFEGLLNISVCLMSTVSGNWIFFSWLSGGTIWYSNLY
jgi:hypothetical protein